MRAAEKWVGAEEAKRLVVDRPQAVLDNRLPADVAPVPAMKPAADTRRPRGIWAKLKGAGRGSDTRLRAREPTE